MVPLIVLALYVAGLLTVGVISSRKVKGQKDFTLAGGSLTPLVLTGTLLATWTGTGSIFGNAEEAWRVGLPSLLLLASPVLGLLVLLFLIGPVRRRGRFTLQDVLEERFGPGARVLGSLTLVSAYLVIVSYQLRAASGALGRVLEVSELFPGGVDPGVLLVIMAVIIVVYTALAGLMSVARTDGINGLLMLAGVALVLPLAWKAAGGIDGVLGQIPESSRHVGGHYSSFDLLSRLLPTLLLIVGDANLHQRFLAARSDSAARKAVALLIPGVLILDAAILLSATAGRALFPELDNPGHVMLELGLTTLTPITGAILVAAILAVIVSTADSYLLSASSSLVRDVYQRFVRPEATEAQLLRMARRCVFVVGAVALVLAFSSDGFFKVSLLAYTIYGVGITPVLLAALFWKRATPAGAITAMLTGGTLTALWELREWSTPAVEALGLEAGAEIGAVVPSVLAATVALVGVSLVTRPRPGAPGDSESAGSVA
ncbi:MAG: sodium:solute symport protein [Planctomycetota bacterium]|nr:MAG: sodium:solute symport protein [Planctomycetota bacterium]